MALLQTVQYFGLDLVHWAFVLLLPLILLVVALIYLTSQDRAAKGLTVVYRQLAEGLREEGDLDEELIANTPIGDRWDEYKADGEALYEGRYLPDPALYFSPDELLDTRSRRRLSAWPATLLFLLALFGLVGSAASITAFPPPSTDQRLPVLLLPLAAGLALSALLFFRAQSRRADLQLAADDFFQAALTRLPVFQDKAGIATLVNQMQAYDHQVSQQLLAFNETARELASGEFGRGIEASVRQIMTQEVTPPLAEAGQALAALARELGQQQSEGMADLADRFSNQVAQTLASHLTPLSEHLDKMNSQLAATERYVESNLETLESSRQQNLELHQLILDSFSRLEEVKRDTVQEIEAIRGHLALVADTTEKMTALYSGEHEDLAAHINQLAVQLQNYAIRLDTSVEESSRSLLAAAQLTQRQDEAASIWLERLDLQLAEMQEIGRVLAAGTSHFTEESESFIRKSLDEYDSGLAEVVERLSFTTSQIRDAIDNLPQALKPGLSG